jgi:hypothetical protein
MTAAARYEIEEAHAPRTIGELFTASKEYTSRDHHSVTDRYSVNLPVPWSAKAAGDPIILQSIASGGVYPVGVLASFLDLIPEVPTTASSISYARETAIYIAFPVATGAAKLPQNLTYASVTAPVETMAGWIRVTVAALDDAEQVGFDITQRLLVGVRKAEEVQVVQGTGTTPQLAGILSTGVAIASAASITAALGVVRGSGFTPNGILLNPANAASAITAATTSYGYDPFRGVEIMYGVPVYYSNAVPANTGIVGDFANGCVIWRRQEATIIVGHQLDDIIKNIVTIVGESRLSFGVTQPLAFNKVTLT